MKNLSKQNSLRSRRERIAWGEAKRERSGTPGGSQDIEYQPAERAAAKIGELAQSSAARSASLNSSTSRVPGVSLSLYADAHSRGLRKRRLVGLFWLIVWALLAACGQTEFAPVAINPEDMCSMCRMAISEKQYAAELITKDGEALKFDDIGCLLDYLKNKADRNQIAAYFVADYESKKWLQAESAHFVKSAELATPMGGNIAAFESQDKAKEAAAKFKGQRVSFTELTGK